MTEEQQYSDWLATGGDTTLEPGQCRKFQDRLDAELAARRPDNAASREARAMDLLIASLTTGHGGTAQAIRNGTPVHVLASTAIKAIVTALADEAASQPREGVGVSLADFRCHNCKRIVERLPVAPRKCSDCMCSSFSAVAYSERKYRASPITADDAVAKERERCIAIIEDAKPKNDRSDWTEYARDKNALCVRLIDAIRSSETATDVGEGQ